MSPITPRARATSWLPRCTLPGVRPGRSCVRTTSWLLAALFAAAACSGGGGKAKAAPTTTTKIASSVALRVTDATVASVGPAVAFPSDLRDAIAQSVNHYVESAVVSPLRSGTVAPDLPGIFTADAGARLNGPDRPTLTEEGVPKATGDITPGAADCKLTALVDGAGQVVLVSAALNLDLRAGVAGGEVRLVRTGDLLFAKSGSTWRVAGFDMSVLRTGPGVQAASGHVKAVPSV